MESHYHTMEIGQRTEIPSSNYALDGENASQPEKGCFARFRDFWKFMSTPFFAILGFKFHDSLTTEQKEDLQELDMDSEYFPQWITNITSLPNIGIATSYFCAGFSSNFLQVPLGIYCIESLSADSSYITLLYRLMWIPWFVKVILGLFSDSMLCWGSRRIPSLSGAWLVFFIASLCLVILPLPLHSGVLLMLVGGQTFGWSLALVILDAMVVERSRFECVSEKGKMLTTAYILKFSGSLLGAILGNSLYMKSDGGWRLPIRAIFLINFAIPFLSLPPCVAHLQEVQLPNPVASAARPLFDVVQTLQFDAVWRPLLFFMIYSAFQWTNSSQLHFFIHNAAFGTLSSLVSSFVFVGGLLVFLKFFFNVSWHTIIIAGTAIVATVELSEGGLVFGFHDQLVANERIAATLHVFFTAVGAFAQAIKYLPMYIIFAAFCPRDAEATMFSLLKGLVRAAAPQAVTSLSSIFPVPESLQIDADTVADGDYGAVWKRSLIAGFVCLIPLLLIVLIPRNREELKETLEGTQRTAKKGIIIAVVLLVIMSVAGSFIS